MLPRIHPCTAALPPLRLPGPSRRGNEPPRASFSLSLSLPRARFLAGAALIRPAVVLPLRRAAGPRYGHWWITQVALATPDLKPPQKKLQSTFYGEVRHATTALLAAGDCAAAPRVRINPHRSIKDQRPRLDLAYLLVQIRSIEIRRSRCGLTACVPVSRGGFAKDTPIFPRFNPSFGQFKRN